MEKISLDTFCSHWLGATSGSSQPFISHFEHNIFDFTTQAGALTLDCFRSSFSIGGFYGSGVKWKERESKWGRKFHHPVMIDTGILRGSIKNDPTQRLERNSERRFNGRRNIEKRRYMYDISTVEKGMYQRGKRGINYKSKGSYAAVHNTDPSISGYTVNQYSSRRPEHRQFIGFSQKIDDQVDLLIPMIFDGFPHK